MKFKKILSTLSAAALAVTALCTSYSFAKDTVVTAADTFTDMDQNSIVADMGAGWNVGNQLEAASGGIPNETAWGNPVITKDLIKAVKDAGFNTVRVPVSYLGYIGDKASGYKIDESWLARVKEVVDYAYDLDMYVIVNMHGDGYNTVVGGWLLCNAPESEQPAIKEKYEACWKQIANKFKDYDEHLIFESMNEEFDGQYHNPVKSYYENINEYNQIFVDTVRQTGSNNAKRWLLIPGWNTDIDYTVGNYGFALPTDKYRDSSITKNRIMISVHYYQPWDFCGDGTSTSYSQWGKDADPRKTPSYAPESFMEEQMKRVYDKFVAVGYPVIIGEYGCINKSSADPENTKFRAYYDNTLCKYAKQYGCVPVYWDNGAVADSFGLFNRNTYRVVMPEIVESIVSAFFSAKDNIQRTVEKIAELPKEKYDPKIWEILESSMKKAQDLVKNGGSESECSAAYDELFEAYLAFKQSLNTTEELVIISDASSVDDSKTVYTNAPTGEGYLKSIEPALTDVNIISKITMKFKVEGNADDSTKVFVIKPYDNETWSGWNDNFVTIGDCTYDEASKEYTAIVDPKEILESYGGNRADGANAINLYYASSDPNVQLTYYSIEVDAPHSHAYLQTDRVEPTETEDGYISYLCPGCGDTYDEILPATKTELSGTINIPGGDASAVTVTISNVDSAENVYNETVDSKFSVKLAAGKYIAVFASENCAERTYDLTVEGGNVTLDAELHLFGDVNGDGLITTADVGLTNSSAKGGNNLSDYDKLVADVSGDGLITTNDVGNINAHAKGIKYLW